MAADFESLETSGVAKIREGKGGLPVLCITTAAATAEIYLQGAQLTHWQPAGEDPVIFLSEQSVFAPGKAIRGGVPICFPWFGPRDGEAAHGFARNRAWTLDSIALDPDGAVRAIFVDAADIETMRRWPHEYRARMIYRAGRELEMTLEVENVSPAPFTYSEALHTYFIVGDVHQTRVTGLENTEYRDFPDRTKISHQTGAITFTEETDRVFINTKTACVLEDPSMGRRIVVEKSGSESTTVWNPWIAKSAALPDFGDDEWQRMVCIETVNAFENSVTLKAGEKHATTAKISVAPLS